MYNKLIIITLILVFLIVGLSVIKDINNFITSDKNKFVGTWENEVGRKITFTSNGISIDERGNTGSWKLEDNKFCLSSNSQIICLNYSFLNNGDKLNLSHFGGNETESLNKVGDIKITESLYKSVAVSNLTINTQIFDKNTMELESEIIGIYRYYLANKDVRYHATGIFTNIGLKTIDLIEYKVNFYGDGNLLYDNKYFTNQSLYIDESCSIDGYMDDSEDFFRYVDNYEVIITNIIFK